MTRSEPDHERATRAAYDAVAADYAELLRNELAAKPWDRAVLAAFAEQVVADGGGPVADLGCGPGRITAHLDRLRLAAFGIDLSPAMVAVARASYPSLRFEQGTMAALDLDDGGLAGIVGWYSIIHTPPQDRPPLFGELCRVLRPGGRILLAFQAGDARVRLERAYGHEVALDVYRLDPDVITGELVAAGFEVTARLTRDPGERERQAQAYLVARRPPRGP